MTTRCAAFAGAVASMRRSVFVKPDLATPAAATDDTTPVHTLLLHRSARSIILAVPGACEHFLEGSWRYSLFPASAPPAFPKAPLQAQRQTLFCLASGACGPHSAR